MFESRFFAARYFRQRYIQIFGGVKSLVVHQVNTSQRSLATLSAKTREVAAVSSSPRGSISK